MFRMYKDFSGFIRIYKDLKILGFRVQGLGFWDEGLRFRFQYLRAYRVYRGWGLGFWARVWRV